MPVLRVLVAAALVLLLPGAATAQSPVPQQTQIQLQYHEVVPSGSDSTPVFLKIFERIQKDCGLVGKAFGRKCMISQINIYMNQNYSGEMAGTKMLNGSATIIMLPEQSDLAPPSSAGSAAPASSRLAPAATK